MRRREFLQVSLAAAVPAVLAAGPAQIQRHARGKMLAGTGEAKITPPVGLPVVGPIQRSTGVHDELFARALVLSDGTRRSVLVCLDLFGLDFSLADEIRLEIKRHTGIANVLLNCSHTHSAPFTAPWSVIGWRTCCSEGQAWLKGLVTDVAEVVAQAAGTLEEVVLRVGRAPVQVGFNRRFPADQGIVMKPYPRGTTVPWVDVLRVDAANGKPVAILFSHAAHPVIVHAASRLISGDYPGYAVQTVKKHFGRKTQVMFAQACGANINGEPWRGGFEAAERAGVTLGEAAIEAATQSTPLRGAEWKIKSLKSALPLRDFPPVEECERDVSEAEGRFAKSFGSPTPSDEQLWKLQDELPVQHKGEQPWWLQDTVLCLRDRLNQARRGQKHWLRFEVTALAIGDEWCLLAMPHEVFAEYQIWFEQKAPFHRKMALAYTNGCESYLPTDRDLLELRGYEAASFPEHAAALRYPHRSPLQPGIEQQIKDSLKSAWT